ncbi:MAG: hypothetical protein O7D96_00205, partial [SAR324 cluster bacterium]|nr:hypothetical protein [SAR324 cluster bacterium]
MVSPRRTALLLLAGLVLAACEPKEEADCDQLLADEKYGQVVKSCEDPSQRAMGYLGLAGFDFLDFLSADDPSNFIVQLGLNPANISLKRELINDAVREVASPTSGLQAFVLLLSAFLGLSVTTTEYLDNGAGATALDNDIAETEVRDATGLIVVDPAPAVPIVLRLSVDYQMTVSGTPYVVDCGFDGSTPICDGTGGTVTVFDDVTPLLGAGLDDTGPDVGIPVATAEEANQVMMLTGLNLPITVDPAKADRLDSFLAVGTLDPG